MTDLSQRLKNLTPEQKKLLEMRLKKKESDASAPAAELSQAGPLAKPPAKKRTMDFSIFFFSDDGTGTGSQKYRLLMEAAKLADKNGFSAVWTPERHFETFGGLYPNPSVLGAALAMITERLQIRAGSVVLPLHSPVRVAEEWGLVDNLSNGRVGISFATGWHDRDYVIRPQNYEDRREIMFRDIVTVRRLWAGETVTIPGVKDRPVEVRTLPRPVQPSLPYWVTASSPGTWQRGGQVGANILSMMGHSMEEVAAYIRSYRQARAENGHDPRTGIVSLMIHTFLGEDLAKTKEKVREPMCRYLKNYLSQFKKLADSQAYEDEDRLLEFAFERYFNQSSLLGTPEKCEIMVDLLCDAGVNDLPCLIDFGAPYDDVMTSLELLSELRKKYSH